MKMIDKYTLRRDVCVDDWTVEASSHDTNGIAFTVNASDLMALGMPTIEPTKGLSFGFSNKCEPKDNPIPVPYRIFENWHDGKIWTTVEWTDKTKTTVSIKDSEDAANTFDAFTAALAKKLYGNMTKAVELMDAALDKAEEPSRERVRRREMIKVEKRRRMETKRLLNELAIKTEMDKIRIQREAEKRINEEEKKALG